MYVIIYRLFIGVPIVLGERRADLLPVYNLQQYLSSICRSTSTLFASTAFVICRFIVLSRCRLIGGMLYPAVTVADWSATRVNWAASVFQQH